MERGRTLVDFALYVSRTTVLLNCVSVHASGHLCLWQSVFLVSWWMVEKMEPRVLVGSILAWLCSSFLGFIFGLA